MLRFRIQKIFLALLLTGLGNWCTNQQDQPDVTTGPLPPILQKFPFSEDKELINNYNQLPAAYQKEFIKRTHRLIHPSYIYLLSLAIIFSGSFFKKYSQEKEFGSFSTLISSLFMSFGILLHAENFNYSQFRTLLHLLFGWLIPLNIFFCLPYTIDLFSIHSHFEEAKIAHFKKLMREYS